MRVLRYFAMGLLVSALLVASFGWYRSAHSLGSARFESCTFDGRSLVLTWNYGVGSLVSPSVDVRGGRILVGLRKEQTGGVHVAVGLVGEARFTIWGPTGPVEYADGTPLPCPPPAAR